MSNQGEHRLQDLCDLIEDRYSNDPDATVLLYPMDNFDEEVANGLGGAWARQPGDNRKRKTILFVSGHGSNLYSTKNEYEFATIDVTF